MLYTQLRSFHAVAKEGGFTAAAKVLRVGQPTITTQVRALEDYFSIELFHRRGRSVSLTEAGRGLYAITQRMLSQEAEARDYMNALSGFHIGHLKLGAVGPFHVTEMVSAFHDRYPKIELSVATGNSQDLLERLLEFQVDVAVLTNSGQDPRVYELPYSRHEIVAFLRRDHPLAKKRSLSINDFADQQLVLRENGSMTRQAFDDAAAEAGVSPARVIEIGSREAIWLAVRNGLGVGVVSDAEFIPHKDLTTRRINDADIFTIDHVVCLHERRESHLIKAFLTVVRDLLAAKANGKSP